MQRCEAKRRKATRGEGEGRGAGRCEGETKQRRGEVRCRRDEARQGEMGWRAVSAR